MISILCESLFIYIFLIYVTAAFVNFGYQINAFISYTYHDKHTIIAFSDTFHRFDICSHSSWGKILLTITQNSIFGILKSASVNAAKNSNSKEFSRFYKAKSQFSLIWTC